VYLPDGSFVLTVMVLWRHRGQQRVTLAECRSGADNGASSALFCGPPCWRFFTSGGDLAGVRCNVGASFYSVNPGGWQAV
jgi:hypothetical protein